jgi:hypothetical protein
MKCYFYFALIIFINFYISCQNDSITNHSNPELILPVILYVSIGEWYSKINIIQENAETTLFPTDTIKRSYASLNVISNKIVYMRDFAIYPMLGPIGKPSIALSNLFETNEKILIPHDSLVKYYYPFWISESEIAIFKQTMDSSSYLIFLNCETGLVDKEIELNFKNDIYNSMIYKASDSILCLMCDNTYLAIIDIINRTLKSDKEVDLAGYFETIQHPLQSNNRVYFLSTIRPYKYVEYNMANNTFSDFSFSVDSVQVVHITDSQFIVYDHDPYVTNSWLQLCDKQFGVINKCMMHIEGVLPYYSNGIYCVTELGDDAQVVAKVDFNNETYDLVTKQIDDNFIFDARIYY